MNWTGGRRARAKQAGTGSLHRQKAYFARIRAGQELAAFSSSPEHPEGNQFIQRRRAQHSFDIGEHAIELPEGGQGAEKSDDEPPLGEGPAVLKDKSNPEKIREKRRKLLRDDDWVCTKISEPLELEKKREEKMKKAAATQATRTRDPNESFQKHYRRVKEAHRLEQEQYEAKRKPQPPVVLPFSSHRKNGNKDITMVDSIVNGKSSRAKNPIMKSNGKGPMDKYLDAFRAAKNTPKKSIRKGPMDKYLDIFRAANKFGVSQTGSSQSTPRPNSSVTTTDNYSQYPTTGYGAFRELSQDGYIKIGREQKKPSQESERESTQDTMLLDLYDRQRSGSTDEAQIRQSTSQVNESEPTLPMYKYSGFRPTPPVVPQMDISSDQLIEEIKQLVRFKKPVVDPTPMPSSPPIRTHNVGTAHSRESSVRNRKNGIDNNSKLSRDDIQEKDKNNEGDKGHLGGTLLEATRVDTSPQAYALSSLASGDPPREPPPVQLNEKWPIFTKLKRSQATSAQTATSSQPQESLNKETNQQSVSNEYQNIKDIYPSKNFDDDAWKGYLSDNEETNNTPSKNKSIPLSPNPPPPPSTSESLAWKEFVEKPASPKPLPLSFTEEENRAWRAFVLGALPSPKTSPSSPSLPPLPSFHRLETTSPGLLSPVALQSPLQKTAGTPFLPVMSSEASGPKPAPTMIANVGSCSDEEEITLPSAGALSMIANIGSSSQNKQENEPRTLSPMTGALSTIANVGSSYLTEPNNEKMNQPPKTSAMSTIANVGSVYGTEEADRSMSASPVSLVGRNMSSQIGKNLSVIVHPSSSSLCEDHSIVFRPPKRFIGNRKLLALKMGEDVGIEEWE